MDLTSHRWLRVIDECMCQLPWMRSSSVHAGNNNFITAFISLSTKERLAKNLGQKIIQIKVDLGDHSYVVPCMAVDGYNCFDSYLVVLTRPDNPGVDRAGG